MSGTSLSGLFKRIIRHSWIVIGLFFGAFAQADQAYIWQRAWSPELALAIRAQSPHLTGFRVLAAQLKSGDAALAPDTKSIPALSLWILPKIQFQAFSGLSGHALQPVIRIPGSAPALSAAQLLSVIEHVQTEFANAGKPISRVEIDFDCAESKLAAYAALLERTRSGLKRKILLDITALPAWRHAPDLPTLRNAADRVTLQVHAVSAPKLGLFDPRMAENWIREWAKTSVKPFDIALPAYGAKLLFDAKGVVIGVEHEAELASAHVSAQELKTSPQGVLALLEVLKARPVKQLGEIIWFRLPLESDQRAWSPATLRAVILRESLRARVTTVALKNDAGGYDLRIVNSGNIPGSAPLRIAIQSRCQGEGIGTYQFTQHVLITKQSMELRPNRARTIAWMRCEPGFEPLKLR